MKFFEKNIKDRFKDASSLKGVDADDLWNNIESVISETPSNRKYFFFRKRSFILLLSIFIIGSGLVWYQFSEGSTVEVKPTNTISDNQVQKINEKNIDAKNVESSTTNTTITTTDFKNSTVAKNEILKDEAFVDLPTSTKKTQPLVSTSEIESISTPEKIYKNKTNDIASNESSTPQINEANLVENKYEISEHQQNSIITLQNFLEKERLVNRQLIDFSKLESLTTLLELKEESQLELKKSFDSLVLPKKESRFSLGAFAGVHTVKNRFASIDTSDQKRVEILNNNFKNELGKSYAVEVNYRLGKNIFITSGFEYLQSQSEFNLILTWDSIVNPSASLFIAERTIKHHNKLNYYSVPVLIGIQKSMGKFEFGTSLGVGFNFVKNQIGKSLNYNEQVAIYPNSENELLPVSEFFTSYHLRPYLNFKLKEKILLQFRTDFRYQHFGNSGFYKLNSSSLFGGFSGGVLFRF